MIIFSSHAKVSDSHPCQVVWVGSDNKPLTVENVTATLFKYSGVVRDILEGPVAMQQTDQDHRYITKVVIPSNTYGETLFVEYSATLIGDGTTVYAEQVISVEPLQQDQTPSNIISVV